MLPLLSLPEQIQAWHDFYALLGTAAATLSGLLFVTVSVATGLLTRDRDYLARSFLSPSVTQLCAVLASSLIMLAPFRDQRVCGAAIAVTGLASVAYARLVWTTMVRHGLHRRMPLDDRIWYVVVPLPANAAILAAGVLLAEGAPGGCALLALASAALLLISLRNAWDMTLWLIAMRSDPPVEAGGHPPPAPSDRTTPPDPIGPQPASP